MRARTEQHLTHPGAMLARRGRGTIGPFDRVITSTIALVRTQDLGQSRADMHRGWC
jgi:hypothetical protein